MATGVVWYWNGVSGWIKQTGVENEDTSDARDMMLLAEDVVSGGIDRNVQVSFTITEAEPWFAREVTVL